MIKNILLILVLGSIFLSACGPEPEPTMSVDEIQGTAVAAAFTLIAETQAAIPTNTPIPPTKTPEPTPLPTNTPVPLPTQPPVVQPTATTESNDDECNRFLQADVPGPGTRIRIVNQTNAAITVSVYLYKTPFGECGFRGYNIGKNGETLFDFPQGTYWITAIIREPINKTIGNGPFTSNSTDKNDVIIREDFIKWIGP